MWARRLPLITALALVAALMVIADSTAFRHADDHHYSEAALQMLATGDWLTPRNGDGTPRLIKPVMTYWMVAASFKLFGAGMFSARLPFILGAGLLVWLTGWLGRRLFNPETGAWSAIVLAANIPWLLAGLRTIPDVWLCVFLTVSCAGFLSCVVSHSKSGGAAWMAWLGLGLAVATKGLIGLLPLGAALLAACWLRSSPRAVLRPLAMLAGLALGVSWYLAMGALHGWDALFAFGRDQLNVTFSMLRVAKQFVAYLLFIPLAFFPWTIGLLSLTPADWREPGILLPDYRPVVIFTVVWTACLVLIFSFAYQFSGGRYLLPAFPWLALLAGAILARATRDQRLGSGRWWLMLMSSFVVLLGMLALLAWVGLNTGLLDEGHVTAVIAATGVVMLISAALVFDAKGLARPAGIALIMLCLLPLVYWQVRPGLPDTANRIVAAIETRGLGRRQPVLMEDRGSLSGVVRVEAAERVRTSETLQGLPDISRYDALVISQARLGRADYRGCKRDVIAFDYERVEPGALLAAIRSHRTDRFLAGKRQPYVIVDCSFKQ